MLLTYDRRRQFRAVTKTGSDMSLRGKAAKMLAGAVTIGTAVAVATVGFPGAAQAEGADSYGSTSTDLSAYVKFNSYGEVFKIFDQHCDGLVPRLQYKVGNSSVITTWENHAGCYSDPRVIDLSWSEGQILHFRACNVGGTDAHCDDWVFATA